MLCLICDSPMLPALRKGDYTYARCEHCGLLSSEPLPSPDEIEAHYAGMFQNGNYEIARRFADQYRPVHAQLAAWMDPQPGERVLDIGCFTGELLAVLADSGADVYGLELQHEAAAIASSRLPGRVFRADAMGDSFPPGPYDKISLMGVIEHVTNPERLIRRAAELLRPEGRLYVQTPNSGSWPARALRSIWPPLAPVEHIHLFSDNALRQLLAREGFSDIQIRPHVKRLPTAYTYEMLSVFGGAGWQRVFRPFRDLGSFPMYVGEMLASCIIQSRTK